MSELAVLGAGAFGTALALALARNGTPVTLWSHDSADVARMRESGQTGRKLPGIDLPPGLTVTDRIPRSEIALVAIPAQAVRGFLNDHATALSGMTLVSCAKGIERTTGLGPVSVIRDVVPDARAGVLTGPSFAADIARGLPTALVLAMAEGAEDAQRLLNRPRLRVYRTDDVTGAELGGALKNVIAIAAGIAIGAGLGDSARASVIARGFAEMTRFAVARGARPDTLSGLSGLGDLVLTCTSEKSRNFAAGLALGRGDRPDSDATIEGIATAEALTASQTADGADLPLTHAVAAVAAGRLNIETAVEALLARPAGTE